MEGDSKGDRKWVIYWLFVKINDLALLVKQQWVLRQLKVSTGTNMLIQGKGS